VIISSKHVLLVLVLVAGNVLRGAAAVGRSEPLFILRVWETEDGLSHNSVASVIQRSDGFLWVATSGGLLRFDGKDFTPFDSPLLADEKSAAIRCAAEEDTETLAIASSKSGLLRLRQGTLAAHPANAEIGDKRMLSLFRERDGVLWIAFWDREVWRWTAARLERFPPPESPWAPWPVSFANDPAGGVFVARGAGVEHYADGRLARVAELPDRRSTICAARAGGIWVCTPLELFRLRSGRAELATHDLPAFDGSPPSVMLETRDGAVWLAHSSRGLTRWDGRFVPVATSHPKITALIEDDEGNLWAATAGGGLNRVQPARFNVVADEARWAGSTYGSVTEDSAGNVWVANQGGFGRIREGTFEVLSALPGWPKRVSTVCADRTGRIWIASGSKLLSVAADGSDLPRVVDPTNETPIRTLYVAGDNSLWIGRSGGTVERYQGETKQSFGPAEGLGSGTCAAITQDAAGAIWLGCDNGELFKHTDQGFARFGLAEGLSRSGIRALYADCDDRLWIATGGGGLMMHQHGKFSRLTEAQGLPDGVLSQILEDGLGNLWFGSRRGLFRVPRQDLIDCAEGRRSTVSPILFGRAEGLSGVSALANNQPNAWKTADGRLWFVTRKGIVNTDPAVPSFETRAPRVYLDGIVADGQAIAPGQFDLPARTGRIDLHFTSPAFSAPEKVRFRYRLEGVDRDWTASGGPRLATYSTLRPGHYRFVVQAAHGSSPWSTPAVTSFAVRPAWWETWWARAAEGVVAVTAIAVFAVWWSHRRVRARLQRFEQQQRIERERTRIARDLHDDLGASLTQATLMAEELADETDDTAELRARSQHVANCVRTIARDLDAVVWSASPKNDTLRSLCSYLCQFSAEYFRYTAVRLRVDVPTELPPAPLSPDVRHHVFMVAKEAMSNVLKHSQASQIVISMNADATGFELGIVDNGSGFDLTAVAGSARNGLSNMGARVAEIGGQWEVRSDSRGTVLRMRFPLSISLSREDHR
jgi:signal transduction histidine kinase/ligand-binding sensor domain-containing protein